MRPRLIKISHSITHLSALWFTVIAIIILKLPRAVARSSIQKFNNDHEVNFMFKM